jgi:fructose-bisphosphate aldolase class I
MTKCAELKIAVCLELQKIIEALTMPGKGLLACDESPSSLDSRFANIGLENTENTRRDYREMLLTTGKVATSVKIIDYDVDVRQ